MKEIELSNRVVKIGLSQLAYAGSRDRMLDRVAEQMQEASQRGVQIVCLQELFASPYPCQTEDHRNFDYAESLDGPTVSAVREMAATHEMVIVTPLFERRAPGVYHNSAVIVDADGSVAGMYRKMHVPDDPLFYEKFYFAPGDKGFPVIETRFAKLGVGICWDQWFPESARLFALAGAEILFYPTAIGWIESEKDEFGEGQHDAWQTSMRAHAIANGVWVGAPNRVGIEGQLEFWGASFIASPRGDVCARAGHQEEALLVADCQLGDIDLVRTHWPFLRDRRVDAYQGLSSRWLD